MSEAQTAVVVRSMTRIMIPFQVDLCRREYMTGLVVDAHLQGVLVKEKWSMRDAGQTRTTDHGSGDTWRGSWEC